MRNPFSISRNPTLRQVELQVRHDSTMRTLAERLIEAREDKGWKKSDLLRAAKLKSPSTLTELESGKRKESPQLPVIADALGVEVLWLQHERGPKKRAVTSVFEGAQPTQEKNQLQECKIEDLISAIVSRLIGQPEAEMRHVLSSIEVGISRASDPDRRQANAGQR